VRRSAEVLKIRREKKQRETYDEGEDEVDKGRGIRRQRMRTERVPFGQLASDLMERDKNVSRARERSCRTGERRHGEEGEKRKKESGGKLTWGCSF